MTRLTAACIAGTIALTASVGAQTPADQARPYDSKMEAKTVTLTGCLAKGTGADAYILSDAVVSPTTAASSTATTTSTATQPTSTSQATPSTPPAPGTMSNPPSTTTPAATGTSGKSDMKMATPGAWAIMSTSGVDLTPHVGHKVELTGTTSDLVDMAHGSMKAPDSSATPDTTKTDATMKSDMHAAGSPKRLNVQSLKMVSATCSM